MIKILRCGLIFNGFGSQFNTFGLIFNDEKWPPGQFLTRVTILSYTGKVKKHIRGCFLSLTVLLKDKGTYFQKNIHLYTIARNE